PEIVEAAMLYALDLAPSLLKQSTVKRGKLSHAIEEILTQQLVPGHAPFAYVALSFPEIRRKIVSIIGRCRDGAFFHEMIRCHWLGRDPQVRRNLGAIRRVAWLDDTYDATFNLPPEVAPAMPAWLLPLGIPVGDKISLLMNLLMVEDPAAHRAAAWALTRIDAPDATTALMSLLEHETPAVRRIARIEIDRRQRTERTYVRPTALRARPDDWARLLESGG